MLAAAVPPLQPAVHRLGTAALRRRRSPHLRRPAPLPQTISAPYDATPSPPPPCTAVAAPISAALRRIPISPATLRRRRTNPKFLAAPSPAPPSASTSSSNTAAPTSAGLRSTQGARDTLPPFPISSLLGSVPAVVDY